MKITKEWLKRKEACQTGIDWFKSQKETDSFKILDKLIKETHYDWANWFIVRVMNRKQCLSYAIYAAEQVITVYEKQYPDDKRPRNAIEAAKKVLQSDTKKNRAAAYAADDAAAGAAYAAAYAAADAAYAAYAAADAAAYAADAAAYAAYASSNKKKMYLKILNYGVGLLRGSKK